MLLSTCTSLQAKLGMEQVGCCRFRCPVTSGVALQTQLGAGALLGCLPEVTELWEAPSSGEASHLCPALA